MEVENKYLKASIKELRADNEQLKAMIKDLLDENTKENQQSIENGHSRSQKAI